MAAAMPEAKLSASGLVAPMRRTLTLPHGGQRRRQIV
jgi:hypothetical protein